MQAYGTKTEIYDSETYLPEIETRQMRTGISQVPPFSLTIEDASKHFGLAKQTLYNYINDGKLHRGIHYLKFGTRVLIVRDEFIKFMREKDGSQDRKEDQHVVH